jgi:hypothetical protein
VKPRHRNRIIIHGAVPMRPSSQRPKNMPMMTDTASSMPTELADSER